MLLCLRINLDKEIRQKLNNRTPVFVEKLMECKFTKIVWLKVSEPETLETINFKHTYH